MPGLLPQRLARAQCVSSNKDVGVISNYFGVAWVAAAAVRRTRRVEKTEEFRFERLSNRVLGSCVIQPVKSRILKSPTGRRTGQSVCVSDS